MLIYRLKDRFEHRLPVGVKKWVLHRLGWHITRILKPGGTLLLNVPFRQALHLEPYDFWRFAAHGLRYLLEADYEIRALDEIDLSVPKVPRVIGLKRASGDRQS